MASELKELAGRLACFTDTGVRYHRVIPRACDRSRGNDNVTTSDIDGNDDEASTVPDDNVNRVDSNVNMQNNDIMMHIENNLRNDYNLRNNHSENNFNTLRHASSAHTHARSQTNHKLESDSDTDDSDVDDSDDEDNWIRVAKTLDPKSKLYKSLFIEQMKHYIAQTNKDDEMYMKMYSIIWNHCSLEAQHFLLEQSGFRKISRKCDAVGLWNLINSTFLKMDNYNDDRIAAFNYQKYYTDTLVQHPRESIAAFKERFDFAIDGFARHGLTPPPDHQAALHFIDKLDEHRFANFKHEYMRELKADLKSPPDNVQHALDIINKYKFNNPNDNFSRYNNNLTRNSSVFMTQANKTRGRGRSNKNKSTNSTDTPRENDRYAYQTKQPSSDKNRKKEETVESNFKDDDVVCYACGKPGHIRPNCPDKKASGDNQPRRSQTASQYVVKSSFFCTEAREEQIAPTMTETVVNIDQSPPSSAINTLTEMRVTEIYADAGDESFEPGDVLLDSCAQTSVINDSTLLTNIRQGDVLLVIEGVLNTKTKSTRLVGDFGPFGTVFYCKDVKVSILSFAEQRDNAVIEYDFGNDAFNVTTNDGICHQFTRKYKMYAANFRDPPRLSNKSMVATTTVREREQMYPQHEIRRAREAVRICRCLGNESYTGLLHLIRTGAFNNLGLTPQDVIRANEIYGPIVANLKGTSTRRKLKFQLPIPVVDEHISRLQTLYIDILFVEGLPFLMAVSKPMNLTTVELLSDKQAATVDNAVRNMVDLYRSYSYEIDMFVSDSESVLSAVLSRVPNIKHNVVGPGVHVKIVESKGRRIKERVRSILSGLPYQLPTPWIHWAVYFAVKARNKVPVRSSGTSLSPAELLTGIKSNAKTDLRISFGEYVQAHEMDTDNSMRPRTRGCIALLPVGNREGSVRFMDLKTLRVITRDSWTSVPITDEIVEFINDLSNKSRTSKSIPMSPASVTDADSELAESSMTNITDSDKGKNTSTSPQDNAGDDHQPLPLREDEEQDDESDNDDFMPILLADNYSDDDNEDDGNKNIISDENESDDDQPTTPHVIYSTTEEPPLSVSEESIQPDISRSGRIRKKSAVLRDESYQSYIPKVVSKVNATTTTDTEMLKEYIFNLSVKQGIELHGNAAVASINNELKTLIDLEVWEPYQVTNGDDFRKIQKYLIRCKMFLKEKILPTGEFDKLKTRLVAGGHMQDRTLYTESSSPTPSINSVFIIASLAAHANEHVVCMDIGNAYVNAKMTGPPVYMRISADISELLCDLQPEYRSYLCKNGELIVKLKKALYGCVQAGLLWFNHIKNILLAAGFVQNVIDPCVFNSEQHLITVIVYVDDLFVKSSDKDAIDDFVKYIQSRFKKVTVHTGLVHNYLGMTLDFERKPNSVNITMTGYIRDLLREYNITKTVTTPANNNLFCDTDPTLLEKDESDKLHTIVAKLLYVATRVRFEILLAVNYLTTRINKFSRGDWAKAMRVLHYLNSCPELGLTLCLGNNNDVSLYADASYGVHKDGKSHSAGIVTLGNATVSAKTHKQKIVTKSSTEAELVCVSDMVGIAYYVSDFLQDQGLDIGPIQLHQDNTSTISMMLNGCSTHPKTRHINVRYFFIKERIENGEINVKHTKTDDMVADILTKPLQGERFFKLRNLLLNSMVANALA